jgi:capsular polysaccharide biosynthesis protein/O-antigen ligase
VARRRWWFPHEGWLVLVVPAVVALALGWLLTPGGTVYKATATMYVGSQVIDFKAPDAQNQLHALDRRMATVAAMVSSRSVAAQAISAAGVSRSPASVASASGAHQIPDTQLLAIDAYDVDPVVAQKLANGIAAVVLRQPAAPSAPDEDGALPRLPGTIFRSATVPSVREHTGKLRAVAVAFLAGLSVGAGMRLARRYLDLTFGSAGAVERAIRIPVLGSVPDFGSRRRLTLSGRLPIVVGAAAAGALVVGSRVVHLPRTIELAAAVSFPAVLMLLRLGRRRALTICIATAAFFCGAPLRAGRLNVSDVFLLAAIPIIVLNRHPRDEPAPVPRGLLLGLGLLIAGGIVGSIFEPAVDPFRASLRFPYPAKLLFFPPRVGEVFRFAYGTVGTVLLVRAARLSRRQIEGALMFFGLGATTSVVWALIQGGNANGRAKGLAGHPVSLGWISAFAAIVGVGIVLSRQRNSRSVGLLIIAASVTGMSLSGTRSSVFILVVGLVMLQFGLRSARRSFAFLLIALLAMSFVLLGAGGETRTRLAGNAGAEQSNYGRRLLRDDSIALVHEHGITGVGLRYIFPPHNLVLGVLGSTGLIGFAGFLILVVSLLRRLAIAPAADTVTLAVLAAALGLYGNSWVVNVGWDHWLWVPLALVLGMRQPPVPGESALNKASPTSALSEWRATAAASSPG